MARHNVTIDWDGCWVRNTFPEIGEPAPGAIEAMRELQEICNPIIFTCRVAPMEIDSFTPRPAALVQQEKQKITDVLESCGLYNIPIWDKPWKPLAAAYVDDKAVRYNGRSNGWDVALMQVKALLHKANHKGEI